MPGPDSKKVDLSHNFGDLAQAFDGAARAAGEVIEHSYTIAGFCLRLRFAGPALVPYIVPAFSHLPRGKQNGPALSICIWDSASTRTLRPAIPWVVRDDERFATGRTPHPRRFYAFYQPAQKSVSMLDADRNVGLYWIHDARTLPYYESGAPLRVILQWWMATHGLQLVHAGAVGTPAGGVLLVGKAGSGKSTAALACLLAGLSFAGDDYVLIRTTPSPFVFSLYNSAKLHKEHLKRFLDLSRAVWNDDRPGDEKGIVFIHQRYPERTPSGFPLRAVLLPRILDGAECSTQGISASVALAAMASSTIFQLPGAGEGALQAMAGLIQQLPCFVLSMGSDISRIAPTVSRLLDGVLTAA